MERAKSRVCPTVNVGIWISSARQVSDRIVYEDVILLTLLVVNHLAFVVLEHL